MDQLRLCKKFSLLHSLDIAKIHRKKVVLSTLSLTKKFLYHTEPPRSGLVGGGNTQ